MAAPLPVPVQRTRMQSLMFDLQQKLQQSPELSSRLQSPPEGKAFTQAIGQLATTEPTSDDVKALQRFLIQLPGVDLGWQSAADSVDGKYGPRSQIALKAFFESQFSDIGKHHNRGSLSAFPGQVLDRSVCEIGKLNEQE